jgi:hypothetical protein
MADVRCGRSLAVAALAFAAACSSSAHDPGVSPGTVTVRMLLPSARSFCDTITCSPRLHVVIGKESGNWLTPTPGPCGAPVPCANACVPLQPCTAGLCSPNTNYGLPITSVQATWDGSYAESSTCGSGAACYNPRFVAPGRYVARLCATPGDLIVTDSPDAPTCAPTGPEECVETTFDLPGPALVEVSLPAQGS